MARMVLHFPSIGIGNTYDFRVVGRGHDIVHDLTRLQGTPGGTDTAYLKSCVLRRNEKRRHSLTHHDSFRVDSVDCPRKGLSPGRTAQQQQTRCYIEKMSSHEILLNGSELIVLHTVSSKWRGNPLRQKLTALGSPLRLLEVLGMSKQLIERLRELCCSAELHGALIYPSPEPSIIWSSTDTFRVSEFEMVGALGPYRWGRPPRGWAIHQDWLGGKIIIAVWGGDSSELDDSDSLEILEKCRDFVSSTQQRIWLDTFTVLVNALSEQRQLFGTELHRGVAQSLTAARLESSMLAPESVPATLLQAIESSAESMTRFVHGKLRHSGISNGSLPLREAILRELLFQGRWRDREQDRGRLELPAAPLVFALAELWRAAGEEVEESLDGLSFHLGRVR